MSNGNKQNGQGGHSGHGGHDGHDGHGGHNGHGGMGNHAGPGNPTGPGNPENIDTGAPIIELAELKEQPETGFLARIRTSINRRLFTSDTLDFSLMVFFQTMMEYLSATIQAFSELGRQGSPPGQDR